MTAVRCKPPVAGRLGATADSGIRQAFSKRRPTQIDGVHLISGIVLVSSAPNDHAVAERIHDAAVPGCNHTLALGIVGAAIANWTNLRIRNLVPTQRRGNLC